MATNQSDDKPAERAAPAKAQPETAEQKLAREESAMHVATRDRVPTADPEQKAADLGLIPQKHAQDPSEQKLTPEWEQERARLIQSSVDPIPDRAAAEETLRSAAGSTSGGRWRVAHTMVGAFHENDIVTSQELGEGVDRLISLQAIAPLDSEAQAQTRKVETVDQIALRAQQAAAEREPRRP